MQSTSSNMIQNKISFMTLLPLFMVILLDVMGIVLVLPVLTPLILQTEGSILSPQTSLVARDTIYGLLLAIFPLFMFFSSPILGDLSDKFGRKKILLVCLIISSISYVVSAVGILCNSIVVLFISRAIAGLAAGTQPIANAVIIDLSTPETKARNLSWIVLVCSIGIIIGPLLGGVTAEKDFIKWFGYETPFILAAVLALVNALFLYLIFKETKTDLSKHPVSLTKGFILFLSAFTQKKFRILAIIYFCYQLAWSLYFQIISWFFMEEFHYSVAKLGLFIGYIGVIFAFATTIVARVTLKLFTRETNSYLVFIFLMAIANIGSALAHTELPQWLWVIVNATSDVICYTIALTLFSNLADEKSQGWIMGVAGAIAAITWTVAGMIAGPLGYINMYVPFWTSGILCLISFILMLSFQKSFHAKSIHKNN